MKGTLVTLADSAVFRTVCGITVGLLAGVLWAPRPVAGAHLVEPWPFRTAARIAPTNVASRPVFTGDYDGDGLLEIHRFGGTGYNTMVTEEVSSEFAVEIVNLGPDAWSWAVDDVDDDGLSDLVLCDSYSGLILYEASEPGEFSSEVVYYDPAYWASHAVNYADLDGDSNREIILAGPGYSMYFYECIGDNDLVWLGWLPLPSEATYSAVGDFDGDGRQELAVGNHDGYLSIFEQGEGILPDLIWQEELAPGGTVLGLTASDVDLDGATELLVVTRANGAYTMYAMKGIGDNDYSLGVVTAFDDPSQVGTMISWWFSGHVWPDVAVLRKPMGEHTIEFYQAEPGLAFRLVAIAVLSNEIASADRLIPVCADFGHDGISELIWPCIEIDGAILQIDFTSDVQNPVSEVLDPPVGSWFPAGTGSVEVVGGSADDFAGIREVEASRDGGETWERISIYPNWNLTIELPDEGVVEVLIRARDCSNKLESPSIHWWCSTGVYSPTPTPTPTLIPTVSPTPGPSSTATPSPTPTAVIEGVDLVLPQSYFRPGDVFRLDAVLGNPGVPESGVPLAIMLEVYGDYWFWPSWSRFDPESGSGVDLGHVDLETGSTMVEVIAPLAWPDTGGDVIAGLFFRAALLTRDLAAIRGRWDTEAWGYGP